MKMELWSSVNQMFIQLKLWNDVILFSAFDFIERNTIFFKVLFHEPIQYVPVV